MQLRSPVLEVYAFDAYFNKKNVGNNNQLNAGFLQNDNSQENKVKC